MATAAELIAQLNALPDDEHAAAVSLLQNDAGSVVKAARSKVFAAGKREGGSGAGEAAQKLTEATERAEAAERALEEFKAKTPDAAAIEKTVRAQLQPKLDAEKLRADSAEQHVRDKAAALAVGSLVSELSTPTEDGTRMREVYAPVVRTLYADRIRPQPDGTVKVLQLGSEIAYEASDATAAVKLLAADVRKQIPPDFLASNADPLGGGQRNGATVTGNRTPPAALPDVIRTNKLQTGAYSL